MYIMPPETISTAYLKNPIISGKYIATSQIVEVMTLILPECHVNGVPHKAIQSVILFC
jgi:hypothetical protein